ncbi:MAG: GNAT family N-acetyltransferase [Acidimicrobiales bacterium]|jgi:ribosomal protein S18 acetylase RimI-like enzyme
MTPSEDLRPSPDRPAPVTVETVSEVTPDLVAAIAGLIPQLSSSAPPPSAEELSAVASAPGSTLFVCRLDNDERPVVGTLTLIVYRIPTGLRAVIEDVVVDGSARGAGAGAALVNAALEAAERAGVPSVDLTSRPSREAANRLYVRMGFEARETNVYRYRRP